MSSFWPTAGAGTFSSGETSFSHLQITQTIYAPHILAKSAGQPYRGLGLKVKAIADNSVRSDLSSSERSVLRNFASSSAKVNALAVDLDERIIAKSLILETKYRAPANRTGDAGAITDDLAVVEPVSPVIERTPVQASLF